MGHNKCNYSKPIIRNHVLKHPSRVTLALRVTWTTSAGDLTSYNICISIRRSKWIRKAHHFRGMHFVLRFWRRSRNIFSWNKWIMDRYRTASTIIYICTRFNIALAQIINIRTLCRVSNWLRALPFRRQVADNVTTIQFYIYTEKEIFKPCSVLFQLYTITVFIHATIFFIITG